MPGWDNFECEFSTLNTKNSFGNSTYYVWKESVLRNAPINQARDPSQMRTTGRYIAYIQPADCERFMNSDETRLLSMSGDVAVLAATSDQGQETFMASRIPTVGCRPFEFNLARGAIASEHVGSPIVKLQNGKPGISRPAKARSFKARRCLIM